jgi:hypothetical protein
VRKLFTVFVSVSFLKQKSLKSTELKQLETDQFCFKNIYRWKDFYKNVSSDGWEDLLSRFS